jgi:formate hydrogenlyase subunit 3/multisubunit Na+/H+ antiporter MnhD subunit
MIAVFSNIYLILFLPLILALICQGISSQKPYAFFTALASCIILLALSLNGLIDVMNYGEMTSNLTNQIIAITTEFRVSALEIIFLIFLLFVKIISLWHYFSDLKNSLESNNGNAFYAVFLLNIFGLIGIFTTDNFFNLFIFCEIYAFTFFAISNLTSNRDLLGLSFNYFCLNAAASMMLIFGIIVIYLMSDQITISQIVLAAEVKNFPMSGIASLLILIGFVIKFFPLWLFFGKLRSRILISNFIIAESLFTKILVGSFLLLKFRHFFITGLAPIGINFQAVLIFFAAILIIYSSIRTFTTSDLRLISVYFGLNNLGFIILSLTNTGEEFLQSGFFYLLNFVTVNLFIFSISSFLKRYFDSSFLEEFYSLNDRKNYFVTAPVKILIIFISALPVSFLFFANWHFAIASLDLKLWAIFPFGLLALAIFSQLNFGLRLVTVLFTKNENIQQANPLNLQNFVKYRYLALFWFLIATICILPFALDFLTDLSLKFSESIL